MMGEVEMAMSRLLNPASGQPGLFGFVGMGPDWRAAVGEAALTQAYLEQLARIFGSQAHRALQGLGGRPVHGNFGGPRVHRPCLTCGHGLGYGSVATGRCHINPTMRAGRIDGSP